MADPLPPPRDDDTRMPRWVKLSIVAGGLFVALLGFMLVLGHGPGQHGQHTAPTQIAPR